MEPGGALALLVSKLEGTVMQTKIHKVAWKL